MASKTVRASKAMSVSAVADGGAESALLVDGVSFNYGSTRALVDCSIRVQPGEIHAILGENGCGKSTLVKILGGVLRPKSGRLVADGDGLSLRSPKQATAAGIAAVYQETLVAPDLSVRDNIALGSDRLFCQFRPDGGLDALARDALDRLGLEHVDLDVEVGDLPLAHRHLITVARALLGDWRILILDEATSALDVGYRDTLFDVIRSLVDERHAVLFISHRFDELFELTDKVTVLRSGRTVGTVETRSTTHDELLSMMSPAVVEVTAGASAEGEKPRRKPAAADVVLSAENVVLTRGARPFGLEVRAGEIVGMAGLEGHGAADFVRVIGGWQTPIEGSIKVRVDQDWVTMRSARGAVAAGISYGPVDRKREGIFPGLPITDNLMVASYPSVSRFGVISRRRIRAQAQALSERLRVTSGGLHMPIDSLSGGNQQKVLFSRWLSSEPRVLALNDPMRGVDVSSKAEIMRALAELVESGLCIVMVSTEVQELSEFCDRVMVFRQHSVETVLGSEMLNDANIVAAMVGHSGGEALVRESA